MRNAPWGWVLAAALVALVIGFILGLAASADASPTEPTTDRAECLERVLESADELIERYGYEHQTLIRNLTGPSPDPSQLGDPEGLGEQISAYYEARRNC